MEFLRYTCLLFTIILTSTLCIAQYYPHSDGIDYTEDYRGQYFFSPKSEWMNDINGLVYQGGKFHMIYQWGQAVRHGGYATSPDLLHWNDEGVALIPANTFLPQGTINVSGNDVYSGSAVVVSGATAEAITGSTKEAIIAIYTGTAVGTCLAWSNDTGKTWHDYPGNPVAHPTTGQDPRDPAVSWWADPDLSDGDQSKWVLGIYVLKDGAYGTEFFGSSNLIDWTYLSRIEFGFECPDLVKLPVDGDVNNTKWVLYDANGSYLVGHFDGTEFTTDPGQQTYIMNEGPDFYAAQTFPIGGLPNNDPRVIQIAWMDHWNGGIGESPWQRNATFPVSLSLHTQNNQIRLARNPISEISNLYESNETFSAQTLTSGSNILNGIKSKKFDLTAEFDLTGTTATKFGFNIANKTIEYDVNGKTLLGKSLEPDGNNRIQIRILADWGMYEVFSNGGIFSYSQQFAFTPTSEDVELYTDGNLTLVSLEMHEVKRIWGPIVQKGHNDEATYSGAWQIASGDNVYINGSAHYSNEIDAYLEYTFTGIQVAWYGLQNTDLGYADVYIDDVLVGDNVDAYSTNRQVVKLFEQTGLTNAEHTIRIVVTGEKNPASSGTFIVHDYFTFSTETVSVEKYPLASKGYTWIQNKNNILVQLERQGDYSLHVYDTQGKQMKVKVEQLGLNLNIPLHNLKSGVYLAHLIIDGQSQYHRISVLP